MREAHADRDLVAAFVVPAVVRRGVQTRIGILSAWSTSYLWGQCWPPIYSRGLVAFCICVTRSVQSTLRFPIPTNSEIRGILLILSSGLFGLLRTALWLHGRHLRLAGSLRLLLSERGSQGSD